MSYIPNQGKLFLCSGVPDFATSEVGALAADVNTCQIYINPRGLANGWTACSLAPAGVASPRGSHTGGRPAAASTEGTDKTPVITEIYLAEVNVPVTMTVTGVSLFNGSAVTDDVKVGLYSAAGALLATNNAAGVGTTQAGADAYQRIPFVAPVEVLGPQTCFIGAIFDGTTSRLNTHVFGDFGANKLTGHVYATAMDTTALTGLVMPDTFATGLGPIASLY